MMGYKITVSKGIAGRIRPNDEIEDWERPRFGFYWWMWIPKIKHNGGRFSKNQTVDVSVMWGCAWLGLIFWPQTK